MPPRHGEWGSSSIRYRYHGIPNRYFYDFALSCSLGRNVSLIYRSGTDRVQIRLSHSIRRNVSLIYRSSTGNMQIRLSYSIRRNDLLVYRSCTDHFHSSWPTVDLLMTCRIYSSSSCWRIGAVLSAWSINRTFFSGYIYIRYRYTKKSILYYFDIRLFTTIYYTISISDYSRLYTCILHCFDIRLFTNMYTILFQYPIIYDYIYYTISISDYLDYVCYTRVFRYSIIYDYIWTSIRFVQDDISTKSTGMWGNGAQFAFDTMYYGGP